jgi:LPXTG-motif cell wall-anchored protein
MRSLAMLGATISAVMLGVTFVGALGAAALPPGTAPTAGQTLSVTSGDATSDWKLTLTAPNNTCPGDGLAGFRWSTFMVPASVDAATLTWNASGPVPPAGVTAAYPLFSSTGSPQIQKTPSIGDALITGVPAFYKFAEISTLSVPNGDYKIGYACHKAGQTERYWQTLITVSGSMATGFNFAVSTPPVTTTTVAPTTVAPTTVAPTTVAPTTTAAAATTTTIRPTTTTTTVAGATTTSVAAGGPTTSIASGSTIPFTTLPATLPNTGQDRTGWFIVWGSLLLVFGRIALLLARPVRIAPPKSR